MKTEFVSVEIEKHIAVVEMHRPPVNALNLQFLEELLFVFDALAADEGARAVILTGHGNIFSAGGDLKDPMGGLDVAHDTHRLRVASEVFFRVLSCPKPTIAAINGPAIGGGLVLVASCDILIASENAFLALPEVAQGLLGGARHAMRFLGHSLTRRMILTGHRVSAAELYRRGAIEKCVPRDRLVAEAREIASEIATKDPSVLQLAKRALNDTEEMSLRDGYAYEEGLVVNCLAQMRKRARRTGAVANDDDA